MASQPDPLPQLATSGVSRKDWSSLDNEFRSIISPIHIRLCSDEISTMEASEIFGQLLSEYLRDRGIIKLSTHGGNHRPRAITRLTNRLAEMKNTTRKSFSTNPSEFLNLVRCHNKAKKAQKILNDQRSARKLERTFRSNPWQFAKSICGEDSQTAPNFSAQDCLSYFSTQNSNTSSKYSHLPDWVPQVVPQPCIDSPFDLSAITPAIVKKTLQKCPSSSAPGPEHISYYHLRHLPSCHHFLATLFTKILINRGPSPRY